MTAHALPAGPRRSARAHVETSFSWQVHRRPTPGSLQSRRDSWMMAAMKKTAPVDQPLDRAQLSRLLDAARRAEPDAEGQDRPAQDQGRDRQGACGVVRLL